MNICFSTSAFKLNKLRAAYQANNHIVLDNGLANNNTEIINNINKANRIIFYEEYDRLNSHYLNELFYALSLRTEIHLIGVRQIGSNIDNEFFDRVNIELTLFSCEENYLTRVFFV